MATSGTTTFNLDIIEIIEEAYELTGAEMRAGYDMKTARRSLDLLMREWGNRGVNFWTIRENIAPITAGTKTLTLPADTIDVIDAAWRTLSGVAQNDRIMTRIDVVNWSEMANKNTPGLPTQYWIQRVVPPVVTFWPVPVQDGSFFYYSLRNIQDVGAYGNIMDVPTRFLPALTAGLAYYLSIKKSTAERIVMLKQEYDRQWTLAAEEDRERAPFRLVPNLSGYNR